MRKWNTFIKKMTGRRLAVKTMPISPSQGVKVPYAVFENEDDVTTDRSEPLGQRLEEA